MLFDPRKLLMEYTPVHGSWLDIAEIAINILTKECIGDRRMGTLGELVGELNAWEKRRNGSEMRINWSVTTDDAHQKLEHLYPRVLEGGIQIDDSEDNSINDADTADARNDEKGKEATSGSDANTEDASGKEAQNDGPARANENENTSENDQRGGEDTGGSTKKHGKHRSRGRHQGTNGSLIGTV